MAETTLRSGRPAPAFLRSPGVRRFFRNRMAIAGLAIVVLLALAAVFAPVLAPVPPDLQNLRSRLQPPSLTHPLGTDEFGRSVLSRVLYGARVSLLTGLIPVLISASIGTLLGLLAGFYRGWLDSLLMRIMDI